MIKCTLHPCIFVFKGIRIIKRILYENNYFPIAGYDEKPRIQFVDQLVFT